MTVASVGGVGLVSPSELLWFACGVLLAKLGLTSTMLASGPVDTEPWAAVAAVRNTMAASALQPEKVRKSMSSP